MIEVEYFSSGESRGIRVCSVFAEVMFELSSSWADSSLL